MILDVKEVRGYKIDGVNEESSKTILYRSIINDNNNYIKKEKREQLYQPRIREVVNFLDHQEKEMVYIPYQQTAHSFYSSYVPVVESYDFMNEYRNGFPYLNNLFEKQDIKSATTVIEDITDTLVQLKNEQKVDRWLQAQKKYNPSISLFKSIQMYFQLLKFGYQTIEKLEKPMVWVYKLCQCEKYFKTWQIFHKGSKTSLQKNENFTIDALTYTLKSLYCPICFIYDCQHHDLSLLDGEFDPLFVHPKQKLLRADHCNFALNLLKEAEEKKQGSQNLILCSEKCYRRILLLDQPKREQQLSKLQGKLYKLSMLSKAIVNLGIQLYSYRPCLIITLLESSEKGIYSCDIIFLYLLRELDLKSRVQWKMNMSEVEMLECHSENSFELGVSTGKKKAQKKKKKFNPTKNKSQFASTKLSICFHHFINRNSVDLECQECGCKKRGYCLPSCLCGEECQLNVMPGCQCKKASECNTKKCSCFKNRKECQPGICLNCFDHRLPSGCKNNQILMRKFKRMKIGPSTITNAGLGVFSNEKIFKDELVTIYIGEVISVQLEDVRENFKSDESFYNFEGLSLNIDGRFLGNRARFINHGANGSENISAKLMTSQDFEYIAFYALKNINPGEELLFNYDGSGELAKKYYDKYPFILKR